MSPQFLTDQWSHGSHVALHPYQLVWAEKTPADLGKPEPPVQCECWKLGRSCIQNKPPERVLWLRRKCHEFTHQGGRNAASAPRGVDSQPADLTEQRGMEPTSSGGDAAAVGCVGIGSSGIADGSESKAADDPLLRARAYPGYPERQVRGLINVPLISRRWRPTIVRTSRDARALVHRRDFGRILRSIRLRHPLVKSLQLLRILGAVPSN